MELESIRCGSKNGESSVVDVILEYLEIKGEEGKKVEGRLLFLLLLGFSWKEEERAKTGEAVLVEDAIALFGN